MNETPPSKMKQMQKQHSVYFGRTFQMIASLSFDLKWRYELYYFMEMLCFY